MNAKEAVAKRITELCGEQKISVNALANNAGISPSTVYSMLNQKSKNPGIISIHLICCGLDISLHEFFDSDIFDEIEPDYD